MTKLVKEFKVCPKCKTEKHRDGFSIANRYKDGLATWCKSCMNEVNRKRREQFENKKWQTPTILDGEIWKDMAGYEGLYKISNTGRIIAYARSHVSHKGGVINIPERELRTNVNRQYRHVTLSKNGVEKGHSVHRLMAITFIPNPENKPEVNHIDGDKLNNSLENLEWVTSSENRQHAYDTGLKKVGRGEDNHRAIFTNEQVREIRSSKLKPKQLANILGVPRTTISGIVHRRTYKYVE